VLTFIPSTLLISHPFIDANRGKGDSPILGQIKE